MAESVTVLLTSGGSDNSLILRQSPGRRPSWSNVRFVTHRSEIEPVDWWVICHSSAITQPLSAKCDPNHTVFISMEPPVWGRPEGFYNQFSYLVSCDTNVKHPNLIQKNGLTWWAGLKVKFEEGHRISNFSSYDYDSFSSMEIPEKRDRISVITSTKNFFPGHRKRLRFIEKLRRHPVSEYIDFFGGYHNPLEDKLDGLLDYKYHIALENDTIDNWWTEKFADPLLAYTLPIYYGCTNISDYFPKGSYLPININNFGESVAIIKKALNEDAYSKQLGEIKASRNMVLNEYNILQLISDICQEPARETRLVTIYPQSSFPVSQKSLLQRAVNRIKRYL